MTSTTRSSSCLPILLDSEWAHLRTSRLALRTARRWAAAPEHPLAAIVTDLRDLDQIVRSTDRGRPGADAILCRLIELSHSEQLAGRIVLQRILPGLIRSSMPYRSFYDDINPIDVAVPAAWLAIRAFDTSRRTQYVAPSLISDAVFQAFRREMRKRCATEEIRSPHLLAERSNEDVPASPVDELIEVISEARIAGVPSDDIDLLHHLLRAGSPAVLANERNVTPRTIRNRRDRAIEHVRSALAIAA